MDVMSNTCSATMAHKKAPATQTRPGAWSDLSRRPLVANSIRSLRPGERVPDSEPKRYINVYGYYRLRWKVGVGEYVEAYEHRVFDGRVTRAPHVHHKNGVKTDNRPENLLETDPSTHLAHHRRIDRDEVVRLYESGLSTPQVGAELDCDAAQVYRILVAEGVTPRGPSEAQRYKFDEAQLRRLHAAGVRSRRIADALGLSSAVSVDAAFRRLGLPPHRTGRPTKAESLSAQAALEKEGLA